MKLPGRDGIATGAILLTCGIVCCAYVPQATAVINSLLRHSDQAQPAQIPKEPISIEGAPTKGDRNAVVTMIIYSDFQCPFCGQFARDTLPALEKRYVDTGKVQLVFRHEPLENHRFAMNAAEIAECAGDQGQFWQMHDLLFQHQKELDEVGLGQRVQELHLDSARVSACKGTKVRERIEVDALSGKALGLRGTPMFVIGRTLSSGTVHVTKIESGARPLEAFVGIIDGLLAGGADTGRTR